MPELIEIEYYRRSAMAALGREISSVEAPDDWYLKGDTEPESLEAALIGRRWEAARRKGKLLLLDDDDGGVLGLRFGMTGRLLVDGTAVIESLEYSSDRNDPAWDRCIVHFADGGDLRMRDPRRLGGVELAPNENALGPDAATVGLADLRDALASPVALKARLLDQKRVAGLGNLLVDETLWRASLDPTRPANTLSKNELRRLHRHVHRVIAQLTERGGSHRGDLHDERRRGGRCPDDGAELDRRTIGGRTTYSCPEHQR